MEQLTVDWQAGENVEKGRAKNVNGFYSHVLARQPFSCLWAANVEFGQVSAMPRLTLPFPSRHLLAGSQTVAIIAPLHLSARLSD